MLLEKREGARGREGRREGGEVGGRGGGREGGEEGGRGGERTRGRERERERGREGKRKRGREGEDWIDKQPDWPVPLSGYYWANKTLYLSNLQTLSCDMLLRNFVLGTTYMHVQLCHCLQATSIGSTSFTLSILAPTLLISVRDCRTKLLLLLLD